MQPISPSNPHFTTEKYNIAANTVKQYSSISEGSTLEDRKKIIGLLQFVSPALSQVEEAESLPETENAYVDKNMPALPTKPDVGDVSDVALQAAEKADSYNFYCGIGSLLTAFLCIFILIEFESDDAFFGVLLCIFFGIVGVVCLSRRDAKQEQILASRKRLADYELALEKAEKEAPAIEEQLRKDYQALSNNKKIFYPSAKEFLNTLASDCILTQKYWGNTPELIEYISNGRANNIREALNLFESEKLQREANDALAQHYQAMEEEARRQSIAAEEQARAAQRQASATEEQAKAAQKQASSPQTVDRTVCIGCRYQGRCNVTPRDGFCGAFHR